MATHSFYTQQAAESAICVVKPITGAARSKGEAQGLKELKIQVQIIGQNSKRSACCKSDGMRFAGADTTVKLCQDTTYIISITTSPAVAVTVEEAEVKHRQAECQEPSMLCCCLPQTNGYADMTELEWGPAIKVPLKERSTASNASRCVYEVAWDCDMALTGRGVRGELALDIAVADFGAVTLPIMAKVYKSHDSSATHGIPLHSIQYQFGVSGLTGQVKQYSAQYMK